jgi:hypothetical protein
MGHLERQHALDEELAGGAERARALLTRRHRQERLEQGAVLDRGQVVDAEAPRERLAAEIVRFLQRRLAAPRQEPLQRPRVPPGQGAKLLIQGSAPR